MTFELIKILRKPDVVNCDQTGERALIRTCLTTQLSTGKLCADILWCRLEPLSPWVLQ